MEGLARLWAPDWVLEMGGMESGGVEECVIERGDDEGYRRGGSK